MSYNKGIHEINVDLFLVIAQWLALAYSMSSSNYRLLLQLHCSKMLYRVVIG